MVEHQIFKPDYKKQNISLRGKNKQTNKKSGTYDTQGERLTLLNIVLELHTYPGALTSK